MPERHVTVDGTRLFVDLRGDPAGPPVLYLHGGPGASCHGFMVWQGELLSRSCFVVGLDQRGVLRSDPLADGERITEQTLVDDCEAVREALGIPQWTVLGHSFGGRIALRYARQHPERVVAVLFENPSWDFDDTERLRLPAAAAIFDEVHDVEKARRCRELAAQRQRFTGWRETVELIGELDERYDDLYFHQPWAKKRWCDGDTTSFPEALQSRAQRHSELMMDSSVEPMLNLLSGLTVPATLIKGRYDLVTGPAQLEAFRPHGEVHYFAESGHFVQLEEAEAYADLVTTRVRPRRTGRSARRPSSA
jgi:proline iminopeptidase